VAGSCKQDTEPTEFIKTENVSIAEQLASFSCLIIYVVQPAVFFSHCFIAAVQADYLN
jgi:hypothetical protein